MSSEDPSRGETQPILQNEAPPPYQAGTIPTDPPVVRPGNEPYMYSSPQPAPPPPSYEQRSPPAYESKAEYEQPSYQQQASREPVYGQPPPAYQQMPGYGTAAYGAAPPYGEGYQQASPPTVVVTSSHACHFGEISQLHHCQFCGADTMTEATYRPGLLTWLIAGGVCLVGCWLGCCLIPFCIDGVQDVEHRCAACHHIVGVHKRLS